MAKIELRFDSLINSTLAVDLKFGAVDSGKQPCIFCVANAY